MLDDEQGIARVAQPVEDADEPMDVARVQADAGFVEDVERVDERGAERGGEIDALDFAAAEGARLAVERQIAQADIDEIAQARADFAEQQIGGFVERRGKIEIGEESWHSEIGSSITSWIVRPVRRGRVNRGCVFCRSAPTI